MKSENFKLLVRDDFFCYKRDKSFQINFLPVFGIFYGASSLCIYLGWLNITFELWIGDVKDVY